MAPLKTAAASPGGCCATAAAPVARGSQRHCRWLPWCAERHYQSHLRQGSTLCKSALSATQLSTSQCCHHINTLRSNWPLARATAARPGRATPRHGQSRHDVRTPGGSAAAGHGRHRAHPHCHSAPSLCLCYCTKHRSGFVAPTARPPADRGRSGHLAGSRLSCAARRHPHRHSMAPLSTAPMPPRLRWRASAARRLPPAAACCTVPGAPSVAAVCCYVASHPGDCSCLLLACTGAGRGAATTGGAAAAAPRCHNTATTPAAARRPRPRLPRRVLLEGEPRLERLARQRAAVGDADTPEASRRRGRRSGSF